jgi:hypothetical protein
MSEQTRTTVGGHEQRDTGADPFEENASQWRQQAEAYARLAREARTSGQRAADAEHELRRRRNRSGQ